MRKIIQNVWIWLVLLFLYAPIMIIMVYSFTDSTMIGSIRGFSLDNYITLLTTPEIVDMIFGTLLLSVAVAVLSTVLGTMGAIGAFYSGKRKRAVIEVANQIPVVNADVVTGFSVCILMIAIFHIRKETFIPLLIGQTALCVPFVYLSVLPRLKQMDHQLYEAALDLGCTPGMALRKVTIPQIVPGIVSGFMTAVTLSLDDYFIATYTKPATFDTISTYVVNATRGSHTEIKTALWALSTIIFLIVVAVVIGANRRSRKKSKSGAAAVIISVIMLTTGVLTPMTGCSRAEDDTIILRVSNWEEYMDEGDWDEEEAVELDDGTVICPENSLIEDFEDWFYEMYGKRVRVEYSTFGTNEELYNQITIGDVYDLVCPSEYMIMKMMTEDMLEPFSESFSDSTVETNYYERGLSDYIRGVYDELSINGEKLSKYAAGYMWGTLGIVYNPEEVTEEEASHWNILLNDKFYKRITIKDSVRDAYFAGNSIYNFDKITDENFIAADTYKDELSEVLNTTDSGVVDGVEDILSRIKDNVYSFETDSGKADMVTGKVVANQQWSGDAVYTMDQADEDGVELCYATPLEATNMWFDGWCMLKEGIDGDADRKLAAEAFINYMSMPESVVRNMMYIGYTSVISGGDSDMIFRYADWCYGAEEDGTDYDVSYFFGKDNAVITTTPDQTKRQLAAQYPPEDVAEKSVVMAYFSKEGNERINRMWTNVRCFDLKQLFE